MKSNPTARKERQRVLGGGPIAALLLLIVFLTGDVVGDEPGPANPLKELPSDPGAHIEKIREMGDNEWLELGPPVADPKWGRARGRAWGGRAFALAPEIRGAYFTGEGPHAFVKPDGHGMDDYWVYDINAHRWICIDPGTDTKKFNEQVSSGALKVNDQGLVVDRDGRIVVGHLFIHAWGFLTYDTHRKKLVTLRFNSGFSEYYFPGGKSPDVAMGLQLLKEQKAGRTFPPMTPISYDTTTGKFECGPAANAYPGRGVMGGFPLFQYLSANKQFLVTGSGRTALYDPEKKSWTMLDTKGARPGNEMAGCYDAKRNRLYVGKTMKARREGEKNPLVVYDVETSTWSETSSPEGRCPQNWSHNRVSVHYDSINDKVVVLHYEDRKIYVFDPQTEVWLDPLAMNSQLTVRRWSYNAFYDPELNVHFVFAARDGADDGVMWAYRLGKVKND